MDTRTCKRCRKFFNYVTGPTICPVCKEKIEQDFQVVRKYIDDNPGVDIPNVAEACEVEPQQIRQWIREERLQFSSDSAVGIGCESCGAMIRSGRFCDSCKTKLTANLNRAFGLNQMPEMPLPKQKGSPRMRFLDN